MRHRHVTPPEVGRRSDGHSRDSAGTARTIMSARNVGSSVSGALASAPHPVTRRTARPSTPSGATSPAASTRHARQGNIGQTRAPAVFADDAPSCYDVVVHGQVVGFHCRLVDGLPCSPTRPMIATVGTAGCITARSRAAVDCTPPAGPTTATGGGRLTDGVRSALAWDEDEHRL